MQTTTRLEAVDPTRHLSDEEASAFALCELLQRRAWTRELGLDPERTDLLALPPVPPAATPARRAA